MGSLRNTKLLNKLMAQSGGVSITEAAIRKVDESPPVEKKRLKCNATEWMTRQRASVRISSSDESDCDINNNGLKKPKSILKRVRSSDTKNVQFNDETFVQHINEKGEKLLGTEALCIDPKDRKAFMHRNLMRISQDEYEQSIALGNSPMYTYHNTSGNSEVHVHFIPDIKHGTKLRMLVKIGEHFSPDEICVKANMSGNKIRVLAKKIVDNDDGSQKTEPFNERFLLPADVDPYLVEARLDNKGNLTIEAPVATHKSDINKTQTETKTKSL